MIRKISKTENELLTQTIKARDDAKGSCDPLISIARENYEFYFGTKPEAYYDGAPSLTSKVIWNHVEGAANQLLPIFTSMEKKALKFSPLDEADLEKAEALTHYLSHKVLYKNKGKEVLEAAIRESFIARISWIKTSWAEEKDVEAESFDDVTTEQLKTLRRDYDTVNAEETPYEGRGKRWKGTAIKSSTTSDLKLENIPLENMMFPAEIQDISQLPYIGQKSEMMKGDMVDMFGKKVIAEIGDGSQKSSILDDPSLTNIDLFTSEVNIGIDDATARYVLEEHYIRTSALSKGKSLQWVQVFTTNDELLEYTVVKNIPYTPIVAVNKVNSMVGWSYADLLKDIQTQQTAILRASTSNVLNIAYPRYQAVSGGYDEESLVNNVTGGVIEVDIMGNVTPFTETPIPSDVYNLMQTLNMEAQRLTGVSDLNQGLDPNVLKGSVTAAQTIAQMDAGSKRLFGYGKNIASCWMNVLLNCYEYVKENSKKADVVYLDGKTYMLFDSKFVDRKMELTPVFGQDANLEQAQLLMSLAERYKVDPTLSRSYNSYQMEKMILDTLGIQNRHLILKDPATIPPTEQEIYQQELQRQSEGMQLEKLGSEIAVNTSTAQKNMLDAATNAQKVAVEEMAVTTSGQKSAEDVITDRMNVQIKAQEAGLKAQDLQLKSEVAAQDISMRKVEFQHSATKELAESMTLGTEIAMEQQQQRPVQFG